MKVCLIVRVWCGLGMRMLNPNIVLELFQRMVLWRLWNHYRRKFPLQQSWIRWWRAQFGWSLLTRSGDDLQWLPYGHPDMQQSRKETLDLIDNQGVHKFLILNYDQVWRNAWSMSKHKLHYKDRAKVGSRCGKARPGQREDKKIHSIKGNRRSITVPKLLYCVFLFHTSF